jgi:hypothetical protein
MNLEWEQFCKVYSSDKGYYVIIELKRGRTADKVIGQVSRYVGFVSSSLAELKKVRAIIVGRNIDRNLFYCVKAQAYKVNLYEFEYQVKFEKKLYENEKI